MDIAQNKSGIEGAEKVEESFFAFWLLLITYELSRANTDSNTSIAGWYRLLIIGRCFQVCRLHVMFDRGSDSECLGYLLVRWF